MNFFKRFFGSKKSEDSNGDPADEEGNFQGVFTKEHFENRFEEDTISPTLLDGSLKMVYSYFMDNKLTQKIEQPINDPANLDQVMDDGFGFKMYCRAFQLDEVRAALFLAYSFSDFLIGKYGFKLYKDNDPEYPLRVMTLKYDKDGVVLSLYPLEYSMKVLNYEASFQELVGKLETSIGNMSEIKAQVDEFIHPKDQ